MEKKQLLTIGTALTIFGVTISAVKIKQQLTDKNKSIDNLSDRVTYLEKRILSERRTELDKWR